MEEKQEVKEGNKEEVGKMKLELPEEEKKKERDCEKEEEINEQRKETEKNEEKQRKETEENEEEYEEEVEQKNEDIIATELKNEEEKVVEKENICTSITKDNDKLDFEVEDKELKNEVGDDKESENEVGEDEESENEGEKIVENEKICTGITKDDEVDDDKFDFQINEDEESEKEVGEDEESENEGEKIAENENMCTGITKDDDYDVMNDNVLDFKADEEDSENKVDEDEESKNEREKIVENENVCTGITKDDEFDTMDDDILDFEVDEDDLLIHEINKSDADNWVDKANEIAERDDKKTEEDNKGDCKDSDNINEMEYEDLEDIFANCEVIDECYGSDEDSATEDSKSQSKPHSPKNCHSSDGDSATEDSRSKSKATSPKNEDRLDDHRRERMRENKSEERSKSSHRSRSKQKQYRKSRDRESRDRDSRERRRSREKLSRERKSRERRSRERSREKKSREKSTERSRKETSREKSTEKQSRIKSSWDNSSERTSMKQITDKKSVIKESRETEQKSTENEEEKNCTNTTEGSDTQESNENIANKNTEESCKTPVASANEERNEEEDVKCCGEQETDVTHEQIPIIEDSEEDVPSHYQKASLGQVLLNNIEDISLLGVQYIIEMQKDIDPSLDECQFICIICKKKLDKKTLLAHIKSFPHRLKFWELHYHSTYKAHGSKHKWTQTSAKVFTSAETKVDVKVKWKRMAVSSEKEMKYVVKAIKDDIRKIKKYNGEMEKMGAKEETKQEIEVKKMEAKEEAKQEIDLKKITVKEDEKLMAVDDVSKQEVHVRVAAFKDDENNLLVRQKNSKAVFEAYPETHPQYQEEWKCFWKRRRQELKRAGLDPSRYDFTVEWEGLWPYRLKELMDSKFKSRTDALIQKYNLEGVDIDVVLKTHEYQNIAKELPSEKTGQVDKTKDAVLPRDLRPLVVGSTKLFVGKSRSIAKKTVKKPGTKEKLEAKPSNTEKDVPVTKPSTVEKGVPVTKPSNSNKDVLVTKPSNTKKDVPVTKPGNTKKDVPVTKLGNTKKDVPVTKPSNAKKDKPVSSSTEVRFAYKNSLKRTIGILCQHKTLLEEYDSAICDLYCNVKKSIEDKKDPILLFKDENHLNLLRLSKAKLLVHTFGIASQKINPKLHKGISEMIDAVDWLLTKIKNSVNLISPGNNEKDLPVSSSSRSQPRSKLKIVYKNSVERTITLLYNKRDLLKEYVSEICDLFSKVMKSIKNQKDPILLFKDEYNLNLLRRSKAKLLVRSYGFGSQKLNTKHKKKITEVIDAINWLMKEIQNRPSITMITSESENMKVPAAPKGVSTSSRNKKANYPLPPSSSHKISPSNNIPNTSHSLPPPSNITYPLPAVPNTSHSLPPPSLITYPATPHTSQFCPPPPPNITYPFPIVPNTSHSLPPPSLITYPPPAIPHASQSYLPPPSLSVSPVTTNEQTSHTLSRPPTRVAPPPPTITQSCPPPPSLSVSPVTTIEQTSHTLSHPPSRIAPPTPTTKDSRTSISNKAQPAKSVPKSDKDAHISRKKLPVGIVAPPAPSITPSRTSISNKAQPAKSVLKSPEDSPIRRKKLPAGIVAQKFVRGPVLQPSTSKKDSASPSTQASDLHTNSTSTTATKQSYSSLFPSAHALISKISKSSENSTGSHRVGTQPSVQPLFPSAKALISKISKSSDNSTGNSSRVGEPSVQNFNKPGNDNTTRHKTSQSTKKTDNYAALALSSIIKKASQSNQPRKENHDSKKSEFRNRDAPKNTGLKKSEVEKPAIPKNTGFKKSQVRNPAIQENAGLKKPEFGNAPAQEIAPDKKPDRASSPLQTTIELDFNIDKMNRRRKECYVEQRVENVSGGRNGGGGRISGDAAKVPEDLERKKYEARSYNTKPSQPSEDGKRKKYEAWENIRRISGEAAKVPNVSESNEDKYVKSLVEKLLKKVNENVPPNKDTPQMPSQDHIKNDEKQEPKEPFNYDDRKETSNYQKPNYEFDWESEDLEHKKYEAKSYHTQPSHFGGGRISEATKVPNVSESNVNVQSLFKKLLKTHENAPPSKDTPKMLPSQDPIRNYEKQKPREPYLNYDDRKETSNYQKPNYELDWESDDLEHKKYEARSYHTQSSHFGGGGRTSGETAKVPNVSESNENNHVQALVEKLLKIKSYENVTPSKDTPKMPSQDHFKNYEKQEPREPYLDHDGRREASNYQKPYYEVNRESEDLERRRYEARSYYHTQPSHFGYYGHTRQETYHTNRNEGRSNYQKPYYEFNQEFESRFKPNQEPYSYTVAQVFDYGHKQLSSSHPSTSQSTSSYNYSHKSSPKGVCEALEDLLSGD